MDRQQIGLKLTLDVLGLPTRLGTFSDRLILQKAIYLAQAAGVHLGYNFTWYLRGPYSPGLTRDAFAVAAEAGQEESETRGWSLDESSRQRLDQLRALLASQPGGPQPRRLELLASAHFLMKMHPGRGREVASIQDVLHRYGKDFTDDEVRKAIEELTQHGLCPGNS